MAWKDLSIREKAKIMEEARLYSIISLPRIREAYNLYSEGGHLFGWGDWLQSFLAREEQPTERKVDFNAYMQDSVNGGNRNRPLNISAMEQLLDSLIARGFNEPQRLAILATAAQEMDARGAASKGVGGNGYLGLSKDRMSVSLLDDSPEGRGKQINYVLEDLTHVYTGLHPLAGNWLDGGSGGPTIKTGQDGSNQFWNATDARTATQILNKSYIRPAGGEASWNNRASVAEGMEKHLKLTGGPLYPFSFSKFSLPSVRY